MILFPAIDLKDGLAVRLEQGDMARATVFNRDPAAQAHVFETQGFRHLHVVDLDGAFAGKSMNGSAVERILETEILQALPRRRRAAHKGDFGKVLIVGSGPSMPGATRLAGEACLRVGAGLVTVAVAPENLAAIASGRPELICLPFREAEERVAMAKGTP